MNKKIGQLESILFTFGDEGVTVDQLMNAFDCSKSELNVLIIEYKNQLEQEHRGLTLHEFEDTLKLITKIDTHDMIEKMITFNKNRQLSQAALETLAIIAYNQPITRIEIEEIRGVNSDMICRKLEALDLIQEAGRQDSVGRPILYKVTPSFLDVFKLTSLDELPEIKLEMEGNENDFFKQS